MNLALNEEQMRAIVTKAILEGLGDEQKALIIQQAVEHMMGQPEENRGYPYNQDKRNRLQRAFDGAVEQALTVVAREEMAKPENRDRLRAIIGPLLEKVLTEEADWGPIHRAIGSAISEAFQKADK